MYILHFMYESQNKMFILILIYYNLYLRVIKNIKINFINVLKL